MPNRIKVPLQGVGMVDAVDVAITEILERSSEIRLEDGSILRVKPIVLSVSRIEGRWDPEGNPLYALKGGQAMTVASAPTELKKPGTENGPPKVQ